MPTDPAPRGADAPDFDEASHHAAVLRNTLINFVGTESVIARCAVMNDAPERISTIDALFNLARAYLALRSPVPAEATSGAPSADTLEVERITREVAEFHKSGSAPDWHPEDVAYDLSRLLGIIARLRTPPAPLPREGATVTEKDVAMLRELVEHDACAWMPPYREAVQRILAALTLAAQPTTKETR